MLRAIYGYLMFFAQSTAKGHIRAKPNASLYAPYRRSHSESLMFLFFMAYTIK